MKRTPTMLAVDAHRGGSRARRDERNGVLGGCSRHRERHRRVVVTPGESKSF
jgi:hypothetical protein